MIINNVTCPYHREIFIQIYSSNLKCSLLLWIRPFSGIGDRDCLLQLVQLPPFPPVETKLVNKIVRYSNGVTTIFNLVGECRWNVNNLTRGHICLPNDCMGKVGAGGLWCRGPVVPGACGVAVAVACMGVGLCKSHWSQSRIVGSVSERVALKNA